MKEIKGFLSPSMHKKLYNFYCSMEDRIHFGVLCAEYIMDRGVDNEWADLESCSIQLMVYKEPTSLCFQQVLIPVESIRSCCWIQHGQYWLVTLSLEHIISN